MRSRVPSSAPAGFRPSVARSPDAAAGLSQSLGNQAFARMVAPPVAGAQLARWDWRDIADPLGVSSIVGGLAGFFASGLAYQADFKRAVNTARNRPVFRAEWDAWGHALTAAWSAGFGGSGHAAAYGALAESTHEGLRIMHIADHDSLGEDTHNQAVGRELATAAGPGMRDGPTLLRLCTQAYLGGRLRVGPAREDAWMPWMGGRDFEQVHRHEGKLWVSRAGQHTVTPANWIEAVDPGPNGATPGSTRTPTTPLPIDR